MKKNVKNEALKNKPTAEVRIGNIRGAIWRNDTENGPRFNVTFERSYREGTTYHSTQSFGRDDLLTLAKVADWTHTRIFQLHLEARTAAVKEE